MSALLVAEDFEPLAGHTLQFERDGQSLPLELIDVRQLATPSPRPSPPFSVLLRERAATQPRGQGMWSVELGARGRVEIFIVPVGPDGQGMCYEAIFN